jgi:hypothetical protein
VCRLIWSGGSATLGKGEHILGRDADAEVFLIRRASLAVTHGPVSRMVTPRSKISAARMGLRSEAAARMVPCRWPTVM